MIIGAVDSLRGSTRERSHGEGGGRGLTDSDEKGLLQGLWHGCNKWFNMVCFVATYMVPSGSDQQRSQLVRTQRPPRRPITHSCCLQRSPDQNGRGA